MSIKELLEAVQGYVTIHDSSNDLEVSGDASALLKHLSDWFLSYEVSGVTGDYDDNRLWIHFTTNDDMGEIL